MTGLVFDRDTPALGETSTAVFSADRRYRYQLARVWDLTRPPATFIMLNPSTADAFRLDPTVRRCLGYARAWGCGSLAVLNLFGLRSTDPAALYTDLDPVGQHNNELTVGYLNRLGRLTAADRGPVIAAWGTHGAYRSRDRFMASLVASRGIDLSALAVTRDGHPGHPLYLPRTARPTPYQPPAPAGAHQPGGQP